MKFLWSDLACTDLAEIYGYIARENAGAARKLEKKIQHSLMLLRHAPTMGRPGRVGDTRDLVIPGTPYIIPYQIKGQTLRILRVYHNARLWPDNFKG